ncbi:conserved hypothetical protein [Methylocella silvestris BL2]|uniref:Catalase n=1 Tax=Methylocella silvestris (strain DSM 15510 / CIP 108128 / LMG 27833 / NCIMB 13906 / BL2) TaxID=395965 RepID=B8EMF9_METSB|nr:catalase family protein [Methylocella silvestris]ACK52087.1 conserved hypothetical protein [Methylocella silvestris BL2]
MPNPPYVPYSDGVEVVAGDEDAVIGQILEKAAAAGQATFESYRHAVRQAHAKSHGVLKGELKVYDNLPQHLRQGLFAEPKTYPIIVRFSTAPGKIHSDRAPSNCGMAIKVLGVEGPKLDAADASRNQDILLVNSTTYFGTPAQYRSVQGLIEKADNSPDEFLRVSNEIGRLLKSAWTSVAGPPPTLLKAMAAPPNHILGETFHSMAALRFGDYIAKLRAAPLSESVRALTGVRADSTDSNLRDLVVEFFKTKTAEYELQAQLCVDLAQMPVEDASVEWSDALSPPQGVAKITLGPQDAYSADRQVYADDLLSFTPWRGLAAHRPLGAIMRLRLKVYEDSSRFRHEKNARPRVEPADLAELPD